MSAATVELVYQEEIQPGQQALLFRSEGRDQRWDLVSIGGGRWNAQSLEGGDNPLQGRVFYSPSEALGAVTDVVINLFQEI